jgi:hypothetical protein
MFNPLFTQAGGYEIGKSLRLRGSASAYLTRTMTTPTDNKKWTWSGWRKRGSTSDRAMFGAGAANPNAIYFAADDSLSIDGNYSGTRHLRFSSQVFRDYSAWYHVVVAFDSTEATDSNRLKAWVNGQQVSLNNAGVGTWPALNSSSVINSAVVHAIGRRNSAADMYWDGQIAEDVFVDGQALTPSSFGETDISTGAWVPKRYTGTYGTNGFYLPYDDGTSLTTLGYDDSGNNNDWTLNNVSLTAGTTYDWFDDTPTNNFARLNPLRISASQLLSQGALLSSQSANAFSGALATFSLDNGKWYWETVLTARSGTVNVYNGIAQNTFPTTQYAGATTDSYGYSSLNGQKYYNGAGVAYGASYTVNDVLGFAYDSATGSLECFKNGVSQGVFVSGLTGTWFPVVSYSVAAASSASQAVNFGQRPFTYSPPTGYLALSSKNLAVPSVKRGDDYFNAKTRTGTGASFSVTGERFSPDLVWVKGRSGATDHAIYDAVRGATKQIESNTTTAESTEATGLTAFNSDGFSGGALAQINTNAATYIDWMWQEAAGFLDIVSFTKTGAAAENFNHNLGVSPAMIILRDLANASNTFVFHQSLADMTDKYLLLNSTAIVGSLSTDVNAPTSTTFSASGSTVVAGNTGIAYLFAEVEGFSKMGSYTGNGSADGPFIWCGFRPRFILIKRTSVAVGNWVLFDTARNTINVIGEELYPNLANAGSTAADLDALSNGFKLRATAAALNTSGSSYVFYAIAETPFKYANAR